jgi:hypothetical protein
MRRGQQVASTGLKIQPPDATCLMLIRSSVAKDDIFVIMSLRAANRCAVAPRQARLAQALTRHRARAQFLGRD